MLPGKTQIVIQQETRWYRLRIPTGRIPISNQQLVIDIQFMMSDRQTAFICVTPPMCDGNKYWYQYLLPVLWVGESDEVVAVHVNEPTFLAILESSFIWLSLKQTNLLESVFVDKLHRLLVFIVTCRQTQILKDLFVSMRAK